MFCFLISGLYVDNLISYNKYNWEGRVRIYKYIKNDRKPCMSPPDPPSFNP